MTAKIAVVLLLIASIFFAAAGKEMKYLTRAQVIYDGKVLESRDIIITVRG
jgi:hypothetical protein